MENYKENIIKISKYAFKYLLIATLLVLCLVELLFTFVAECTETAMDIVEDKLDSVEKELKPEPEIRATDNTDWERK